MKYIVFVCVLVHWRAVLPVSVVAGSIVPDAVHLHPLTYAYLELCLLSVW